MSFFVSLFICSAVSHSYALSCDSGSLADTCYISSAHDVDGESISGAGSIIVQSGGILRTGAGTSAIATIDLDGDLEVLSGGRLEGNFDVDVNDLTLHNGGVISADYKGYAGGCGTGTGQGPGGGTASIDWSSGATGCQTVGGSGGGYGGNGGTGGAYPHYITSYGSGGQAYGSDISPADLGSGGGGAYDAYCTSACGGHGGGSLHFKVSGVMTVEGVISSAGAVGGISGSSYGGSGSGGSIWIEAASFIGGGALSCDGASAQSYAGAGSGGRIALHYGSIDFDGVMSATGGLNGWRHGGHGSIYIIPSDSSKSDIRVYPVDASGISSLVIYVSSDAYIEADITDYSVTVDRKIRGNVRMSTRDLTVPSSGRIDADGKGFLGGYGQVNGFGPGGGGYVRDSSSGATGCQTVGGSGGGHGGQGGTGGSYPHFVYTYGIAGSAYDSESSPTALGSGGGGAYDYNCRESVGAPGGGAVRIDSDTVTVEGTISAKGYESPRKADSYGGGGSGGSILINAANFQGSGSIVCDGGNGLSYAGAGSGGRVAINYGSIDFDGLISSEGGTNDRRRGEQGGIYIKSTDSSKTFLHLYAFDSSGLGAVVFDSNECKIDAWITDYSVTVDGGIAGNMQVSVKDLTVSGGATVSADSMGYPGGFGGQNGFGSGGGTSTRDHSNGATGCQTVGGSGGGHGGKGGTGGAYPHYTFTYGNGGVPNDSPTGPTLPGSGGGGADDYNCRYWWGGSGGGVLRLDVSGTLQLDGEISVRGTESSQSGSSYGGAGAGGSALINAGSFKGSGSIVADGGNGLSYAGAGGGGRIAVNYGSVDFAGTLSASGGSNSLRNGQHGSIYVVPSDPYMSTIKMLPLDASSMGSVCFLSREGFIRCSIQDHSVTVNDRITGSVSVSTMDLTILSGARINADYNGYPGGYSAQWGFGSGGGQYCVDWASGATGCDAVGGSGGGYGGAGGRGASRMYGGSWGTPGPVYGSEMYPLDHGSGGGGAYDAKCTSALGGSGGGLIILNISSDLTIDGTVSAAGSAGIPAGDKVGGGGSGGSVYITTYSIAGGGSIATNGGQGIGFAGGGGGGRIAVHYCINDYAGTNTSLGGPAWRSGGAGTVGFYLKPLLECGGHCTNGVKDFDEQGTDCGGADCPPCKVDVSLMYWVDDDYGIQQCSLWTDIPEGVWVLNQTDNAVVNGSLNSFFVPGVPIGVHRWNVECTDTEGHQAFASNASSDGWVFTVG